MTERTLRRPIAPTLHYRTEGQGPAVMLIHGVGADLSSWDAIAPELAADFTVLRLDLRGHGQSGHIEADCSLTDFVQDVVDVLADAGIAQAHIVGFSLGGLIAQGLALDHPDRVDRLVLLSAVTGRTAEERERMQSRVAILREQGIAAISGASQDRWFTPAFIAANPEIVRTRMEQLHNNHAASYLAAYTAFATGDLADRLDAIRAPTLIATGEHDSGSNPRMAHLMHDRIAGSELRILPDLRHSVLVEAPEQITAMLQGFLRQQAKA